MFSRVILLLLIAVPVLGSSPLDDLDPDLSKSRPLVVLNQEIAVEMSIADILAAREINSTLSGAQLARWRRIQREQVGQKDRRTIFDFSGELQLTPQQAATIQKAIATLKKVLDDSRAKIALNHTEIRKLHPALGMAELSALPRPDVLVANNKDVGLSSSQLNTVKGIAERLHGYTEECRRRIVRNAASLQKLQEEDAALERIRPFVKADAEVLTELTLAGLRSSIAIHEALTPEQRNRWHHLELSTKPIEVLK